MSSSYFSACAFHQRLSWVPSAMCFYIPLIDWLVDHFLPQMLLSLDLVTVDGVWIGNWIYWTLWHITRDYNSQITVTERLVFSVTVFTVLLGSGFQRQTFPFLRLPELSPASATSFCNFQPTACLQTLYYDKRLVGQSVLVPSTHLRLKTIFLLLSDSCGFVNVGHPFWREDGSVVYHCCWTSSAQSFSGSSPTGLIVIFYSLRFNTLPTWGARSAYLYPQGTRRPSYIPPNTGFPFRRLLRLTGLP
jgi:hypothetical protein